MQELTAKGENKTFFKLKEGSNYKIIDTYREEYIVEFEQFKKILLKINDGNEFVTVNDEIINRSKIYKIEPTNELTHEQKNDKSYLNKFL